VQEFDGLGPIGAHAVGLDGQNTFTPTRPTVFDAGIGISFRHVADAGGPLSWRTETG